MQRPPSAAPARDPSSPAPARDGGLDRLDQCLVDALQIRPRAPWTELAPVLGADAVALARRWRRLVSDGRAWVTAHPHPEFVCAANGGIALVEITAERRAAEGLAARLAHDAAAVSVDVATGGRDLLVTVMTARLEELLHYVQHRFAALPGVVSTRTHVVTAVYADGGGWRLRALDATQRGRLTASAPTQPVSQPVPYGQARVAEPGPGDADLVRALGVDGRATHTDLAARTGTSATTVARRMQRLVASGTVRLRCEVAQPESGRPVGVTLWLRVPPARLASVARELAVHPDVRMCAAVAGTANLVLRLWLPGVAEIPAFEAELLDRFRGVDVVERALTLRPVKRLGRLLDGRGRAEAAVPMDLWGGAEPGTPPDVWGARVPRGPGPHSPAPPLGG
ncbi:Lrp/AsnC family transcriptional regulator [Yinghuangia seranimata]|uniref:Lrp/AsnC family transcriptional regulator n=1 Tax=Yinghuangia seranimata TaxID=408067 RepID=UPI00248BB084|nr:Lrp/AsnC family transcriptional regulator [Yinghuangia seranimata]MDI2132099.1 Lrp/AsnC family transcriptional regulator [Yinghuangia seranimata]